MTQVKTRKQRVMFNVEHSVQYLPPQGGVLNRMESSKLLVDLKSLLKEGY
jgi:acetaldehyde dehydrogenase (acetylating)